MSATQQHTFALEHPVDELARFKREIEKLRAGGLHKLADCIERGRAAWEQNR